MLEANFDDKVKYLGYDLTSYPDGTVAAFDNVTITHYWECTAKLSGDYQVFVHIDGMGNRINGDHDPAGAYPTLLAAGRRDPIGRRCGSTSSRGRRCGRTRTRSTWASSAGNRGCR